MKRLIMLMSVSLLMLSACGGGSGGGDSSHETVTLESFNTTHYPDSMSLSPENKMIVSYYYVNPPDISAYTAMLESNGFSDASNVWQNANATKIFKIIDRGTFTEYQWEIKDAFSRNFLNTFSNAAAYNYSAPNAIFMRESYSGDALNAVDTYITNLSGFTLTNFIPNSQNEYTKTKDGLLYKVRANYESIMQDATALRMTVGDPAVVEQLN